MYDSLNKLADWRVGDFPKQLTVLLSDSDADSSFVINHFLSTYMRLQRPVVMVTAAQYFTHYAVSCMKIGANLEKYRTSGRLKVINFLERSLLPVDDEVHDEEILRNLYLHVKSVIETEFETFEGGLLVIDDLTTFLSIGMSSTDVAKLMHYMTVLSKEHNSTFVTLIHRDAVMDSDFAFYENCRLFADTELDVTGLSSGYSKDISGHLSLTQKTVNFCGRTIYKNRKMHYCLNDRSLNIFSSGTAGL